MTPLLIGYLPKRIVRRGPDTAPGFTQPFPAGAPVEEICSASRCLAPAPEGWRQHATFNHFDVCDSPAEAWRLVPAGKRTEFQLFAWCLWPVLFSKGREEPMDLWWEPKPKPLPTPFIRLGWDAVASTNGHSFGCSPLSCNGQAGLPGVPWVNRHCLVSSRKHGVELARRFSLSEPEPGPYCAVEVWRKRPETT